MNIIINTSVILSLRILRLRPKSKQFPIKEVWSVTKPRPQAAYLGGVFGANEAGLPGQRLRD